MASYTSAESDDLKRRFITQVEDQVYADMATLQELKRCFDGLHLGLFTRDNQVSRNLMAMPLTSVRDLCVFSYIECSDRDMEFMAVLKDIHREVQRSMKLKLKVLNFCCEIFKFVTVIVRFESLLYIIASISIIIYYRYRI
ncbi:hypothetical protein Hanom_Chr13g01227171 [Helianthus anomalus]